MAYSYENELKNLKEAQKKSAVADLENTRNTALSNLEAEKQTNAANYNAQRNTANIQNKLSARNFQEYLASTGRANSGLASQARLQNSNNLNTQLNSITGAENASLADIARRTTDAQNTYNSGLAAANANIEANYIQNLLDQRQKAAQLAQQEKEFKESVRQFNEQMKYNYKTLSFRGGSGGGSGSSSGGSSKKKSGDDDKIKFIDTSQATNILNKYLSGEKNKKWAQEQLNKLGLGNIDSILQQLPKDSNYNKKTTTKKSTKTSNKKVNYYDYKNKVPNQIKFLQSTIKNNKK